MKESTQRETYQKKGEYELKKLYIFILAILVVVIVSAYSPNHTYLAQDNVCPDSPAMLKPGDLAVVTVPQDDPLNLRVGPGLDQRIIIKIPAYAYITIIAGPTCDGGYRWYEIGWNGQDGWSAEVGPDGIYNMLFSSSSNPQTQIAVTPLTLTDRWPDSLIGIWEGDISCQVTFRLAETCKVGLEISRRADGLLVITNIQENVESGGIQTSYKKLGDNQYYYCFDIYDVNGYGIGESCFQLINANELNFNEGNLAGSAWGKLERVGRISDSPINGIIQIGPDIFVIIQGQRRLVPNPETVDALGISRDMIDNMGLSEAELIAFSLGPDIPDVIRDYSGFQVFKELYDIYFAPNYTGNQIVPTQVAPVPEPYEGQEISTESESPSAWCRIVPLFCAEPVQGATNVVCDTQCVPEARSHRPDMNAWIPRNANGNTTSADILVAAQRQQSFTWDGQDQLVSVRDSLNAQAGDLVIWPQNCSGVTFSGGHIGYVESVDGILITITDSNWGKPISQSQCSRRDSVQIQILPCMKFISSPYPVEPDIPSSRPVDKCSQYSGFSWLLCKIGLK